MIVYFSGTGNSRYCAQMLAFRLDDELLDSAGYIRRQIAAELNSGKPWVFVCPTYAWQIPRAFASFIRSGTFQGSEAAYFVMTCGGETGDAGSSLEALCREAGLTYRGVLPVVMPENYVALFSVPDEAESARIVAAARPVLEEGAACIRRGEPFPAVHVSAVDRCKSGAVNQGFYKFYVKAKAFYAADACISCGRCAELCPLNNIALRDGRPVWGEHCTHCMACICGCPEAAIEYGRRTRGRRRYWCPEYEGTPKE